MSERITLKPASKWVELRTTQKDWDQADPQLLGTLLSHMILIS